MTPIHRGIRIISIVPGSAAHKCGLLEIHDQLMSVESEAVFGWSLKVVRERIHGTPGSHVTLDFQRDKREKGQKGATTHKFRINLMRGSPQYTFSKARSFVTGFGHCTRGLVQLSFVTV